MHTEFPGAEVPGRPAAARPGDGSRYDDAMPSEITAAAIKTLLQLVPHPREGGWFRQTWKAEETIPANALPARYSGERSAGTAIYYLLEPDNFSEMHQLVSDEVFHFYLGDPVEMLQLGPGGEGRRIVLGQDIGGGQLVQTVVPQGVWQGSRLIEGGRFALLGCTVSPGFDYADYGSATRAELERRWPAWAGMIACLTRQQESAPD
jgi:uncharacterized protein